METKKYKLSEISLNVTDGEHGTVKDDINGKYLLLSCKNIKNGIINISSNERIISGESFNKIQKRIKLEKNDVLITTVGTIGEMAIIEDENINYCFQRSVGIIKPNKEIVNPYYLYYSLKNELGQIDTLIKGAVQKCLFINDMKMIEISLPDLKTQNKIVKVLHDIDEKIKLNNEVNNNLHNLGKSYFENFISNCDEEVAIKEIADEVLDYTKNKNERVKLLNSSDVTENIFPKVESVDNKNLKGHFKKRFKKYDILYSQIRPRNHHYGYVLLDDSENYLASTRFMIVRNKKEKVSSSLLYYYLTSKNAVEDFTTKTELRSGTFPQGNYEDLSSYVVRYSSNQESITKILDSILETINNNNNENEKLSELRDNLLPKLMNGEIDLNNIEI